MPEEIDPFAVKEQPEAEKESSPQEDMPEVVDAVEETVPAPEEIIDSINSVPNPVHSPSVEKESILSRVKPRGRKKRKTPPPVDGVAPYDSSNTNTIVTKSAPQDSDTKVKHGQVSESIQEPTFLEQQFEDIPDAAPNINYQEPAPESVPYQTGHQQPDYQQPEYQQPQYQADQQSVGYTNPLLTNQPLPVNYTTSNIYDPYNPYAAMVDINQNTPGQQKPTDWRFIIALGAAIICLAGLIFFWIMWISTASSLTDATIQIEDLRTSSETGQKAANQLTDLQTTIRELNTKIEDLQEENDELKKNEDEVKDLEKEITSLESKVKDLQNENATLTNDVTYWKKKAE